MYNIIPKAKPHIQYDNYLTKLTKCVYEIIYTSDINRKNNYELKHWNKIMMGKDSHHSIISFQLLDK
jgi:hypothetical protein